MPRCSLRPPWRTRCDGGRRRQTAVCAGYASPRLARAGRDEHSDVSSHVGQDHARWPGHPGGTGGGRPMAVDRRRWPLPPMVPKSKACSPLCPHSGFWMGPRGLSPTTCATSSPMALIRRRSRNRVDKQPTERAPPCSSNRQAGSRPFGQGLCPSRWPGRCVIVNAKALSEIPPTATALRTQRVTEVEPALATRIEVKTQNQTF